MCKLDRYILRQMIGPFVFGVGAFVIVLVSIDLLYDALKLIVREGLPAGAVAQAFLYRIPQTVALTLPMATMFSALMTISWLSSGGELVAMRVGGVAFGRIAAPVLFIGLLVSGLAFAFNEAIVPQANAASHRLLEEMKGQVLGAQDYVLFQVPQKGRPERIVYARHFDPISKILKDVWIAEFRGETFWETYEAQQAVWQGQTIVMQNVTHVRQTTQGRTEIELRKTERNVRKAPWEMKQIHKEPEDMTLVELREQIHLYQQLRAPAPQRKALTVLREHYQIRLATPWCALGFALIGVALGPRSQRTSTGIGLGVSLVIILAYYIVFNICRVIGEQGTFPPVVAAWLPNLVLFAAGGGLLIDASR